jgi:Cys-tRNA(Pro)/Cys-tRNA(Cys) deacylase
MTPAIIQLEKNKVTHKVHKYEHDPAAASYGLEAAEKLAVTPERVFKTLVAELDNGKLAVAIIPVDHQLNLKKLAKACKVKKAHMASPDKVERSTGYVLGGVSPLGQKKRLATYLASQANHFSEIFVSAGKRGLEVELSPEDLLNQTQGQYAEIIADV